MAKKDTRNYAAPTAAAVGGATAAGAGYALHRRAKNLRATATKKLRRVKAGKAAVGVAALAAGAAALRGVAKNPRVKRELGLRRAAASIGRGSKGKSVGVEAAERFAKTPTRPVDLPVRAKGVDRSLSSRRRAQQASATRMAQGRMRKVSNASVDAFFDELSLIWG